MLNFKLYSFLSLLFAGGAIINAFSIYEQFYPSVLYLSSQKANKIIFLNLFFMIIVGMLMKFLEFIYGEIREVEKLVITKFYSRW